MYVYVYISLHIHMYIGKCSDSFGNLPFVLWVLGTSRLWNALPTVVSIGDFEGLIRILVDIHAGNGLSFVLGEP